MSSFEDVLGEYEPPGTEDIVVPGRARDAKPDSGGAEKSTGDTGGNAAVVPAGAPVDSQNPGAASSTSTTAPEPAPQLPEGSDDDDAVTADTEPEETAEDAADADPGDAESNTPEPEAIGPENEPVQGSANRMVIPRKGGSLSFEGPSVNLKHFPRALIDQMREILKPRLGDDFARDISQFSLVTAFVMAAMSSDLVTDEFTKEAVRAFRENDPKTEAIEKRTVTLLEQQAKQAEVLRKIFKQLGEVADTTMVLEMGQAYALAERTAQLDTQGFSPETIDVTQKRAVASRDNIRKRVKIQQQEEKVRNGRPFK